jgi:hypothetical protein
MKVAEFTLCIFFCTHKFNGLNAICKRTIGKADVAIGNHVSQKISLWKGVIVNMSWKNETLCW